MLELYLGGARSGKSRLAETQAEKQAVINQRQLVYLATATAGDEEMAIRIRHHQHRRRDSPLGSEWITIEEPIALADTLIKSNHEKNCVVVDCLTLWLSNLLLHSSPDCFAVERQKLISCLPTLKCQVIFVSNEVGQGVVPANALSRRFVDESGFLHQQIASLCDRLVFVTAGIAQVLKGDAL